MLFVIAALGVDFPGVEFGAGLKAKTVPRGSMLKGELTRFRFCRACGLPAEKGCDFTLAHVENGRSLAEFDNHRIGKVWVHKFALLLALAPRNFHVGDQGSAALCRCTGALRALAKGVEWYRALFQSINFSSSIAKDVEGFHHHAGLQRCINSACMPRCFAPRVRSFTAAQGDFFKPPYVSEIAATARAHLRQQDAHWR